MIPAWLPVKDAAAIPRSASAMETRAIEIRSPAVSSMSSSRPGCDGADVVGEADQVVGRLAHRATPRRRRRRPSRRVLAMWSATARIRSASATEVPPNFWTASGTAANLPRAARLACRSVPSDKRARQRAMREIKLAEQERRDRRRKGLRRGLLALVVVGAIVAIVVLVEQLPPRSPPADQSTTTTTGSTATTSTTQAGTPTTAPVSRVRGRADLPARHAGRRREAGRSPSRRPRRSASRRPGSTTRRCATDVGHLHRSRCTPPRPSRR